MFGSPQNTLFAIATIVGITVGAGIFGLPYVVSKSGLLTGLFYFILLGGSSLLLNLLLGEIVLRTKEKHRLVGYARKYLGRWGGFFMTISILFSIGTLLAYIILGGNFLKILISPWLDVSSFSLSLFFGLLLSPFIFLGIKFIAPAELFSNTLFLLAIFTIFLFAIPQIRLENFHLVNIAHGFLPYGVALFAFSGLAAIPEISEILKTAEERRRYKGAIIASSAIIFFIYLLFSVAIVGVSGSGTTSDALGGLEEFLGPKIIFAGALAGLITLADSFLIIGLYARNTFIYDYRWPKIFACCFVVGLPLVLFWAGAREFIATIGIVGAIAGAAEAIAVIFIFQKAKMLGDREPEYDIRVPPLLLYSLVVLFAVGFLLQLSLLNL